jgi:DNA-binding transcriptional ArsR family regulator
MSPDMPKRNGVGIDLLADPTRRAIVAQIALGIGQPALIAARLGLSRPATSRQLRILRQAHLISVRRHFMDGRRFEYFIRPLQLGQITAWLAGTEVGRAFPPTPARIAFDIARRRAAEAARRSTDAASDPTDAASDPADAASDPADAARISADIANKARSER